MVCCRWQKVVLSIKIMHSLATPFCEMTNSLAVVVSNFHWRPMYLLTERWLLTDLQFPWVLLYLPARLIFALETSFAGFFSFQFPIRVYINSSNPGQSFLFTFKMKYDPHADSPEAARQHFCSSKQLGNSAHCFLQVLAGDWDILERFIVQSRSQQIHVCQGPELLKGF